MAAGSALYGGIKQLDSAVLSQVEAFFANYQKVRDIESKVLQRGGIRSAVEIVERASKAA